MALCRVWYKADKKIFVTHGPDLGLPLIKNPAKYSSMQFEDMDDSLLPQDRKDRDRWRGSKSLGISIDTSIVLRQDLNQQIDAELAEPSPDLKKVIRLQRRLAKRDHD